MKKIVRLTESELISVIRNIITESPLGTNMLKDLYGRIRDTYPDVKYDEGDKNFDPYIYIPINKTKKTGLLIELDSNDNFEIHYDNGREDRVWSGWKRRIERLNAPKHVITAIDMFMKQDRRKN